MPDANKASLLTVQDYQDKALLADQLAGATLAVPLLGLFGETGSLLSEAKKSNCSPGVNASFPAWYQPAAL